MKDVSTGNNSSPSDEYRFSLTRGHIAGALAVTMFAAVLWITEAVV